MRRLYIDTSNLDQNENLYSIDPDTMYAIKDLDDISYNKIISGKNLWSYIKRAEKAGITEYKYYNLDKSTFILNMKYKLKEDGIEEDSRDKFYLEVDTSNNVILGTDLPESFVKVFESNNYSVIKFKNNFVVPIKIINTSFSPLEVGTFNSEACTTYIYTFEFTIFEQFRETITLHDDSLSIKFRNMQITEDYVKFDLILGNGIIRDVYIDNYKTVYRDIEFSAFTFNHFLKVVLINHE